MVEINVARLIGATEECACGQSGSQPTLSSFSFLRGESLFAKADSRRFHLLHSNRDYERFVFDHEIMKGSKWIFPFFSDLHFLKDENLQIYVVLYQPMKVVILVDSLMVSDNLTDLDVVAITRVFQRLWTMTEIMFFHFKNLS